MKLDHLVPLALGGCPDCRAILWPQPWSGSNNAHDKDRFEKELHHRVCMGRMSLGKRSGGWLRTGGIRWTTLGEEPPLTSPLPR